MGNPVARPTTDREGTSPRLIVGGTVVAVAVVSFAIFALTGYEADPSAFAGPGARRAEPPSTGTCGVGSPDDSYSVTLDPTPNPPRPEGTTFRLTVRQGGRVVTRAKVCVMANMPSMLHPGLNTEAKEGLDGRYETELKFGMGGSWEAAVIIAEPGKPVVSVTVPIEVAEVTLD